MRAARVRGAAVVCAVAALAVVAVVAPVGAGAAPAGAAPAAGAPAPAGAAAAAGAPAPADGFGLHVVSSRQVDARLLDVTVSTAALPGPAQVDVLLPTGYAQDPTRRYPVLYLLDGTSGHASDWTTSGGAEQTTAGLPVIVVMPDITLAGNGGGWCTNWVNGGRGGPPEWETFHIDELIPWVDATFRTEADRGGRAIAGLSQGGSAP